MRVVFVTREPIIHQFGGSTTAALNLLEVLVAQGCQVDMLVTDPYSRSPRLFWRQRLPLPAGITLHLGKPGIGTLHLNPFSLRAWARFAARLAKRFQPLAWLGGLVHLLFGNKVVADAWDLTPPTQQELAAALAFIAAQNAEIVVVNYAFWGSLLSAPALHAHKRIILMHDMLSARAARFQQAGLALDCIPISHDEEISWLNQADIVLAIQNAEAEAIRPLLTAEVLVQPIVLSLRPPKPPPLPNPNHCLFIGTRIQPNQTGIQWFLDEVWPLILTANPAATLTVAGSVCEVIEPGAPHVTLAGILPSLAGEFASAAVCIVPLLVGSGLKIKLLEALAQGKACVSTPIGVQGLEDAVEGVIEVAGNPADFAAAVLRLMQDQDLRQAREQASLSLVRRRFRPESEAARAFAAKLLATEPRPSWP
ncbi:glycosyltransferase [Granulicella tundricola]|uniref:Glycosyl transferase group 1 n=1 Tax=Granulicella tundricola (strain ATCC BAA-1859 / DSM 23138 / MP5ACTX9) TaxID=1198114 RepID=E8X6T6_GRATM|nr:glycosyltransferase [Granulicella tundricola]ADW71236.1 glycosyl transferase group 1 [Granulicella tundricola MP5ACTX9]